jgi:MFS family permease
VKRLPGRRDLTVLAVGLAVSTAGDAAALVALLLRLRPEGSGWVAALLAGQLIPVILLASLAGIVVDRFESHRVLVIGLIGQAVLVLPLALVSSSLATVLLFAGLNAFATFVRPATSALVPVITGSADAGRGFAAIASGISLGWIVGPAVGGLLTGTFGSTAALLMDAVTFAVLAAAAAILRVRRPPLPTSTDHERARGGFALLWHTPALRIALIVSAIGTACAVIDNVAAPFRFIDQLGASSTGYGLYLTIWGAGAFIGVQVVPRLGQRRLAVALAGGNLLSGLGIAGIGLAPTLVLAFIASALGGIGNGLTVVAQNAFISANTPSAAHGRAFAAASATTQGAIGIGTAAGAPLVGLLSANRAMITAGGLSAIAATGAMAHALRRKPSAEPSRATHGCARRIPGLR